MKKLNNDEVFEAVAYAGASTYPWYESYVIEDDDEAKRLRVVIADEGVRESGTLMASTMRRALDELLEKRHPGVTHIDWNDDQCDVDVDADIADQIIQQAVLGDVVFG